MDFFQVQAFLAVAQDLHFGRAAEELRISQPALSRRIRDLEKVLGVTLFERSTRRVSLAPAGEAFLKPAEAIAENVALARRSVASAGKGETGRVRVAFAGPSTHVMVGRLTKEVRKAFPGIDVEVYSSRFAVPALNRVIDREMEICLGRWNDIPYGIATRVVANEYLVVAVPANHPLAGAGEVSMRELRGEPFVSLPRNSGSILDERLHLLALAAGFIPDIVQVAPDSWTLVSLVAADIGCSLTLSSVAENVMIPGVSFLRLADRTAPIRLRMAWREHNRSPALKRVLTISERLLPTANVEPAA